MKRFSIFFLSLVQLASAQQALRVGQDGSFLLSGVPTLEQIKTANGLGGLTVGTSVIAGGTSGRIPFNNAGVFSEDSGMYYDPAINKLTIGTGVYPATSGYIETGVLSTWALILNDNLFVPSYAASAGAAMLTDTLTIGVGGTVATSSGSNVITDGVAVNDKVIIGNEVHKVASVTANTITLTTAHSGATAVPGGLIPEGNITIDPAGFIDINAVTALNLNGGAGAVNIITGSTIAGQSADVSLVASDDVSIEAADALLLSGTTISLDGVLSLSAPLTASQGGTGVSNAGTLTLPVNTTISGGGTISLGGFTLTVPSTGTAVTTTTISDGSLASSFTTVRGSGSMRIGSASGINGLTLTAGSGFDGELVLGGSAILRATTISFSGGSGTISLSGIGNVATITSAGHVNFVNSIGGTPQTLSGAGAVNVTTLITKLTSTATGNALTLANGTHGQLKKIIYAVEAAGADTLILTPTTKTGFSTITLDDVSDSVSLIYFTTQGWMIESHYGATIAP